MKRFSWLVLAGMVLLLAYSPGAVAGDDDSDSDSDDRRSKSRVRIGFELAPVPLDLRGRNRALVGLGSYLVNATGGCNDCHTSPSYVEGGNPFLGETEIINSAQYLAGGTPFGPFISRNLTPDEFGRPAGLTFEEFLQVMRTGVDRFDDGTPILQVMPWPVYGQMRDRDLRAIYEFLSAIPSLPNNF